MQANLQPDPWLLIEAGFQPENNVLMESRFAIANGRMGHRANFEEQYSGEAVYGSYVAGVTLPLPLQGFCQKKGAPTHAAWQLNAANWIGIDVRVDGEVLDLATCRIKDFQRGLNFREGVLERSFVAKLLSGKELRVHSRRFCSIVKPESGAIRYTVSPLNFSGNLTITPYVDFDVPNSPAAGESCWEEKDKKVKKRSGYVVAEVRGSRVRVCTAMKFSIWRNKQELDPDTVPSMQENYVECAANIKCKQGDEIVVYKYAAVMTSGQVQNDSLQHACRSALKTAFQTGFDAMLAEHADAWAARWARADIQIEGDVVAQQAIRFHLYHLMQAFDPAGAICGVAPKGFTAAHFSGTTWQAETFCFPFLLGTGNGDAAHNWLINRRQQLPQAVESGLKNGAALFPFATIDGSEGSPDCDLVFEAIHRNGAVAFALSEYVRHTGDDLFLGDFGLEMLIAIARYWVNRAHWSEAKRQFVIHGVTGPDEYERHGNNNWFTNYIARWSLNFALSALSMVKNNRPESWQALVEKLHFDEPVETNHWRMLSENLYFPKDDKSGIFLQQEGYADKPLRLASELTSTDRPVVEHWSWDRVLRAGFLQQADVLLGMYLFESDFDEATLRQHFYYYEPRTLHENPLSFSIHSILAARLGDTTRAFGWYQRLVCRNFDGGESAPGLSLYDMGGVWLAFVKGLAGLRIEGDTPRFQPFLPPGWAAYSFKFCWRGSWLQVRVDKTGYQINEI